MKNIITILLVGFATSCVFAQQAPESSNSSQQSNNNGNIPVVGIRIGNGSSSKVNITSDGEAIAGYIVYDNNGNVVKSSSVALTHYVQVDTSSLSSGAYYVVALSEAGHTVADMYFKQ